MDTEKVRKRARRRAPLRRPPVSLARGLIIRWCCLQRDIENRKRAERVSQGEKALLELIASGSELPTVLHKLCELLDSVAEGCFSGVLLLDPSHQWVKLAIAPSLPDSYNRALEGLAVSLENGPCGMAATLQQQVIVSDLAAETRWSSDGWPGLALAHGIRSCWSTPVLSRSGESLATFAVYQRSPGTPTAQHEDLMQRLTQLAGIAIERARSEEALSKARLELAHAARVTSLGMLTASIAHELNQPLSGIVTNASTGLRMLTGEAPNLEGARRTTQRTLRDAQRAGEVIARLRALFGGKATTPEPVDLNDAACEVLALLRIELQQGRVVLCTELSEALPQVHADRVQLQQVILNLLLNAVAAMAEVDQRPRQLLVQTTHQAGEVCLSVRDSGVGIGEERIAQIFDAFFTTKSHGMGIGLSVSRAIIEEHRGRIWAKTNEGPGATFTFALPAI